MRRPGLGSREHRLNETTADMGRYRRCLSDGAHGAGRCWRIVAAVRTSGDCFGFKQNEFYDGTRFVYLLTPLVVSKELGIQNVETV